MKTRKKIGIPKATTHRVLKVMDLLQIINQHWDDATNKRSGPRKYKYRIGFIPKRDKCRAMLSTRQVTYVEVTLQQRRSK